MPCSAVAQTDGEILRSQAEGTEQVDKQGNHFGVGRGSGVSDQVAVELKELSQASPLLALVAEAGADIEPAHRLWKITVTRRDHPSQRRCYLGTKGHGAFPLINELIELPKDLATAVFLPIELCRFQCRTIELDESVPAGCLTPFAYQIVPTRKILRKEIAEAG